VGEFRIHGEDVLEWIVEGEYNEEQAVDAQTGGK
tara:strand:+ start:521 stop:622 length:102 start_codon:yes stop_codon:yes gene_type:complete